MSENLKNNKEDLELKAFIEEIDGEEVAFESKGKERKLTTTKICNIRKRKDGYYNIKVDTKAGERIAIVPKDTLERLMKEKTSFRPLKDRYNTLSALTPTFDKPLMYYGIVAYDKIPKEEYETWTTSNPLLKYEMIHLNGDLDDIREENIRLTHKDKELWKKIKEDYKSKGKVGADIEYARQREENLKKQLKDYPNLKIMVRVIDTVKKATGAGEEEEYDPNQII